MSSKQRQQFYGWFVPVMGYLFSILAADIQGQGTPKKNSQYQNYLNQLRTRFQIWDLNGDNILDKAELARAFRGPQAKPYDYVSPDNSSKTKKSQVKQIHLALVSLPRPSLPMNFMLAEALSRPDPPKTTDPGPNPAVVQYGDFQFLALIGKNDVVYKKDFDNWCSGYAKNLDRYQELQREIKLSQEKLAKAKTAKEKQTTSNELTRHQTDWAAVNLQLSAISPTIQAALNVKR